MSDIRENVIFTCSHCGHRACTLIVGKCEPNPETCPFQNRSRINEASWFELKERQSEGVEGELHVTDN